MKISKQLEEIIISLDTPEKIQRYIDTNIEYDPFREDRSVEQVIEDQKGECYNGALLAVACLSRHGYKCSIIELLAKDDEEHIICVYKSNGRYGAIGQSKFLGLKSREPIYMSVHDLAVSYKEFYYAFDGRYSLLSYTNLFPISKYKQKWITSPQCVIQMEKDLRQLPHYKVLGENDSPRYVSPERFWAEVRVIPEGTKIPESYLKARPK